MNKNTFEIDGFYYHIIDEKPTEVEVVKGEIQYSGDIVLPTTVNYNGQTYNVTTIGKRAFEYCTSLTSIDFGNVTTIEDSAFKQCTSLTSIDLKNVMTIKCLANAQRLQVLSFKFLKLTADNC